MSLCGALCISCEQKRGDAQAQDQLPSTILKISSNAKLYTTEIQVHKIVLFDDVRRLKALNMDVQLPLGSRKVAIPIDATLKAYIDFSQFSAENVKVDSAGGHKKLVVTLPNPQIELTGSKVDHAGTKQFISALRSNFSNQDMAKFTKQGIEEIKKEVPKMGLIETCRQQAANVLLPLFAQIGYNEEDVSIVFRSDLKDSKAGELVKVIE